MMVMKKNNFNFKTLFSMFFMLLFLIPTIISYNWNPQPCIVYYEGSDGRGPSCFSLHIEVTEPDANIRKLYGPDVSSCTDSWSAVCSNQQAIYTMEQSIDYIWGSLATICTGSKMEGNYYFDLFADDYSILRQGQIPSVSIYEQYDIHCPLDPPLHVRWDSDEDWCTLLECGRGDWLGSSIVSNNCCSPRTMDLLTLKYTNEDCNVIIGDSLCYFRDNATLVEPTGVGEWLAASDFTGEIVYEECGRTSLSRNDGYEYVSTGSFWEICNNLKIITITGENIQDIQVTHQYLCNDRIEPRIYSFAECASVIGTEMNMGRKGGGAIARGGHSVNVSSGDVYFCNALN
ncbi:MAG: hypothetical protein ACMXYG_07500, partial [Candidatus Woesearchaeota archaeon]